MSLPIDLSPLLSINLSLFSLLRNLSLSLSIKLSISPSLYTDLSISFLSLPLVPMFICHSYFSALQNLVLNFSHFSIESSVACTADYLQVIDGDDAADGSLVGRFCGDTVPPLIQSTAQAVRLRLHTNDNAHQFNGFRFLWYPKGALRSGY